jgi:hypothetical protein
LKWEPGPYLLKENLREIVPYPGDVLKYKYLPGWKCLLEKLGGFFNECWENIGKIRREILEGV